MEEAFGNDSTKFVKVPWDVLQAYYFRASRGVMAMPEASRLAWLEGRDIAERTVWVSRFREGNETLGQVVQAVMKKKGAHWDTPITYCHNVVVRPSQAPQSWRGPTMPPPSHNPKKMTPGTTVAALRDGSALCPYWNAGECKWNPKKQSGASCDKGLHRCSKVLKKGRPCGMRFHGAHNCRTR